MADMHVGFVRSKEIKKTNRVPLVFASGVLSKSFTVKMTANLTRIILEMPSFAGVVVTGALKIENEDGTEIYEVTGMAEDDTHVRKVAEPVADINTVTVTLSADPEGDGTCYVTIYAEG